MAKISLFALLVFTVLANAASPLLTVQNNSTVQISGRGYYRSDTAGPFTNSYSHAAAPNDPNSPFDSTQSDSVILPVSVGPFFPLTSGGSDARQTSFVTASHMEASGAVHSGAQQCCEDHYITYDTTAAGLSTFDLLVEVLEPTFYHFVGTLDMEPWSWQDISRFSLSSVDSSTPLIFMQTGTMGDFFHFDKHRDFDQTGVLLPGTYQLTAVAQASSTGNRYDNDTGFAGFTFAADFTSAAESNIVTQPRSRTNVIGSSLMLSVNASGSGPLTYQWYKEGTFIPGATGRTYVLSNVQATTAGQYNVRVSGSSEFTLSSDALLTVLPVTMPAVIGGPIINPDNGHAYYLLAQSRWVEAETQALALGGHLATIRNAAEQEWVLTNFSQWEGTNRNLWIGLYDGDPVNNATNRINRQGEFVWSSGEPVNYANWNLSEPNNYRELGEYYVHTLSPSEATGGGTWNDTWDSDQNSLPIYGVVEVDVVPPTIGSQPEQQIVPLGGTALFSVSAHGNPAPSYQWLFNDVILPGADQSNLIITNVDTNNLGGYSVIAGNFYSATTSSVAMLLMSPSVRSPFTGDTVLWGGSAALSASIVGSGDLSYQWFSNEVPILWGTNSTLVFSTIQTNDGGLYSVVATSPWGSVTNGPAPLTINAANVSMTIYPEITIEGVPGFNYGIQYTTDLRDTNTWTTLTNLTLTMPVETWVDMESAGKPHRYYRIIAQ